ncbi:hypothetical protein BX600DRAFT_443423 [Xylariales sp. PMI_506]|nr:hypothetical protein BX600DRAFT_443423 [Xylariales sp. PMI_506]
MPNSQLGGFSNFDPDADIPSLGGKVIFITGGTAGLGRTSIIALSKHEPAHIYFTGRNGEAAARLVDEVKNIAPSVPLTFVQMDMSSLADVKSAVSKAFTHNRLDILICCAGIMAAPPGLSKDGFEIQFAVNHLGNAMVIQQLLPILVETAKLPDADVRVVSVTSEGWSGHPKGGIVFEKLRTTQEGFMWSWFRYGQSKLANIVYAAEIARRYPQITSVSIHPGVVKTDLVTSLTPAKRYFTSITTSLMGRTFLTPEEGSYSQLWAAVGAKKEQIVNGAFYYPVGKLSNEKLDDVATSEAFAKKLWDWTDETFSKIQ